MGGDTGSQFLNVVRGLDGDAVPFEVVHGEVAEFLVKHTEDCGGDVVDCDLEVQCQYSMFQ